MTDQSFGRELRLRKQADFDRVYGSRLYAADEMLVVSGCRNDLGYSRLGLSISRKVGGAAVRNRWKRLVREAFRLSRGELPAGWDLVVRPQKGAVPSLAAIKQSLPPLVRRLDAK